jgi:predicted dehydrogenase
MGASRLGWGILGTALIARQHMIPALQEAAAVDLLAVASRHKDNAVRCATDFSIPTAHSPYEALLADDRIDCVYLPLPNQLHASWIMRAADSGKHILCEKPLALTVVEAERVADHCADRGIVVMEAFMYRFHPAWVQARDIIAGGRIGRITDVAVWFSFRSTRPTDFRHTERSGGGALYDVGCYAVDVIRTFLGDHPEHVVATARLDPTSGVDLTFSGILDYGSATGTFTCSMEQEPRHTVIVHGTDGWISVADPFNCPADFETTISIGTGGSHHPHASSVETISIPAANQYALQATAMSRAILAGEPSPHPIQETIHNTRIIERLLEAARINR